MHAFIYVFMTVEIEMIMEIEMTTARFAHGETFVSLSDGLRTVSLIRAVMCPVCVSSS